MAVTSAWLAIVAGVSAVWGVALFVADRGPLPAVWVWPDDLLSARLVAAMLFTLVVCGVVGRRRSDTARMALWITLAYAVGVVAAAGAGALVGTPVPAAYVAAFAVIGIGTLAVGMVERRATAGDPGVRPAGTGRR